MRRAQLGQWHSLPVSDCSNSQQSALLCVSGTSSRPLTTAGQCKPSCTASGCSLHRWRANGYGASSVVTPHTVRLHPSSFDPFRVPSALLEPEQFCVR
jgi:hypothetical protein